MVSAKTMHRAVSMLLACVLLFSMIGVFPAPIKASAEYIGVYNKLQTIRNVYPNQYSYFTSDAKIDYNSADDGCYLPNIPARNGLPAGSAVGHQAWSCYAFASYVWYCTFGFRAVLADKQNYTLISPSQLKIGDFMEFYTKNGEHAAIYLGEDADNWYVFDSNWAYTNQVRYYGAISKSYTIESCRRATNYDAVNKTTSTVVDNEKPVITEYGIESQNCNSVNLYAYFRATDNIGVDIGKSKAYVWTKADQSDLKEYPVQTNNNGYFWARVPLSDFNYALTKYTIHLYARDAAGNEVSKGVDINLSAQSVPSVSGAPIKDGTYLLQNHAQDYFMTVQGGGSANKTAVTVNTRQGNSSQRMAIKSMGDGTYQIYPECANGKVIDIYRGTNLNASVNWSDPIPQGGAADIWDADDAEAQRFKLVPVGNGWYVFELNSKPGYVLGTTHTGNNGQLAIQRYTNISEGCLWRFCDGNGNVVDACNHTYNSGAVTKQPTCKEAGVKTFTCTRCGKTRTESIAKLTTHTYNSGAVTKNPTCKEEGVKTFTCTVCGTTRTESVAKLTTHSYNSGVVTKQPTCKDTGVKTFTCTVCGATRTETVAKTTTHSYNSGVVTKQPTCKDTGVKTFTCTVCGATRTESVAKLTTHSYNSGVVTKQPTETQTGIKTFTCTVCGTTKTETIPVLVHTHKYTASVVAPTCTAKGYTTHTCTCGESYTDNETAALGHSYNSGVVTKNPTCKDEGIKTFTCSRCNATRTESVAKLTTHSYNSGVVTTQPTASQPGVKTFTCTVCGTTRTESIPALPSEDTLYLEVPSLSAAPGKELRIPVTMKNNPSSLATLRVEIQYDETILTLKAVENGTTFGDKPTVSERLRSGTKVHWDTLDNTETDAVLMTLVFEVKDTEAETTKVELKPSQSFTIDEKLLTIEALSFDVAVQKYLIGDATGDGLIDARDVLRIRKYLADWEGITIVEAAADVTADGTVDLRDVLRLRKYLAGWDVALG